MKAGDLRTKTEDELNDQLEQLEKEAFNLRFQTASGQLETPRAGTMCAAISRASKRF